MSRLALFASFAALALFLSGCVQGGIPQSCSGVAEDRLSNCIYVRAVLEQNAYHCYGLSRTDARKECINDASNPAMKKKLEGMSEAERAALTGLPPAQPLPSGAAPSAPQNQPAAPTEPQSPAIPGTSSSNLTLDQQVYASAIESNDVQLCEAIIDEGLAKSCISKVSRQRKDISSCDTLSNPEYSKLCRLYSMGDA
jgi:hypothetical protein